MKVKKNIQRQIWFFMAVLLIALAGASGPAAAADAAEQYTYFSGILDRVEYGAWAPWGRKAVLVLQPPESEAKTIAIHTGFRTEYVPHRTPKKGDQVTVKCIQTEGTWAAVTVNYQD